MEKIGRLAFREEGKNWNAYYAMTDTMEGALFLGSIKMRFVENKKRKRQFMNLMKDCFGDVLYETIGTRPSWPDGEQPAPEHERSKNA